MKGTTVRLGRGTRASHPTSTGHHHHHPNPTTTTPPPPAGARPLGPRAPEGEKVHIPKP